MPYAPKISPLEQLNTIVEQTASNIGAFTKKHGDFTRNRKLNAATTIKVALNMRGNALAAELMDAFPGLEERMTVSAYEQAKGKLTPEVFEYILKEYNSTAKIHKLLDGKYRVFAIDGSDFTVPHSKDSSYVVNGSTGRPKKNGELTNPFCQVHANIMFDLKNRTYQDCILQPKTESQERAAAYEMLQRLDCGKYIVIMDRGYDGFNMIENCNKLKNCSYIIRTKTEAGGIKEIANLPGCECDEDMSFLVTTSNHYYNTNHKMQPLHYVQSPKKHRKEVRSPNTAERQWNHSWLVNIKCRVVKFRINAPSSGKEVWEVLLTNLDRDEFPVKRLKKLYHMRWDIETSFRELKYALGGIHFHSKKDDFIQMEILAHLIMFNAVSRSIAIIVVPQAGRKYPYAVDFKMACLIVRKYYRLHCNSPPNNMFTEMLSYTVPIREGRSDTRNVKPKSAVWFTYRVA